MRSRSLLGLLVLLLGGCDNSSLSVTAPNVSVSGVGASKNSIGPDLDQVTLPERKFFGVPDVWMVPNIQSDVLEMFRSPEQWEVARGRLNVFGFYMLQVYDHSGFECPSCGPNTLQSFKDVVPGGAFRWLNERGVAISLEVPALKDYSCDDPLIGAQTAIISLNNIASTGGQISFISLDEPFTSGLLPTYNEGKRTGCGMTVPQVVERLKNFNNAIRSTHPKVQVGLIEPYPHFSAFEIEEFVLEIERQGITLPFLHIDFFLPEAVGEKTSYVTDLARLRSFSQSHNIPFGVIVFGADGSSSESYARDAWATALAVKTSVGVTEHFILQSWAEHQLGNLNSPKTYPHNLPEGDQVSMTGILLRMFQLFGISYQ